MIRKDRIVELSNYIISGKEHFKLETKLEDVTKILPEVKHRPDIWYMLGEVTYCTHVGTHIEVPIHHKRDGKDIADFPFRQLIGPLVILDFRHKKSGDAISLEDVKAHDKKIHAGDMVFVWSGMDKFYRDNEHWNDQPHLTVEAGKWLVEKKIGCLGSDCSGLEVPGTDYQPIHQTNLDAGIPIIESLKGLEQVASGDWIVFILPLPIVGLEASPLRVIAIPREQLHEA